MARINGSDWDTICSLSCRHCNDIITQLPSNSDGIRSGGRDTTQMYSCCCSAVSSWFLNPITVFNRGCWDQSVGALSLTLHFNNTLLTAAEISCLPSQFACLFHLEDWLTLCCSQPGQSQSTANQVSKGDNIDGNICSNCHVSALSHSYTCPVAWYHVHITLSISEHYCQEEAWRQGLLHFTMFPICYQRQVLCPRSCIRAICSHTICSEYHICCILHLAVTTEECSQRLSLSAHGRL